MQGTRLPQVETLRRVLVAGTVVVSASCSLLMSTDSQQCSSDADCVAHGVAGGVCVGKVCQAERSPGTEAGVPPASTSDASGDTSSSATGDAGDDAAKGGAWACLGSVQWPGTSATPKVKLSVMVIDVLAQKPPNPLTVKICPKLDPSCSSPLPGDIGNDAQGRVVATVSAGFDGYLELTSPSTTPALFFPVKPVWEDTVVENMVPVVSQQGFQGIAQAISTTLDLATKGHIYALVSNCSGKSAEGVQFALDNPVPGTAAYYMINNAPVGTATQTDSGGSGGFLNVPPGFSKLKASVAATGARIGEASFVVRAGAVSYPRLLPMP